jgi:hypothetical protein
MYERLYEWFIGQLDEETEAAVRILRPIFEASIDNPRGGVTRSGPVPSIESYQRVFLGGTSLYDGDYSGTSKWDRIGKPFIEDMVVFNRRIHFWNPAGKILGMVELHMKNNPDWDSGQGF